MSLLQSHVQRILYMLYIRVYRAFKTLVGGETFITRWAKAEKDREESKNATRSCNFLMAGLPVSFTSVL